MTMGRQYRCHFGQNEPLLTIVPVQLLTCTVWRHITSHWYPDYLLDHFQNLINFSLVYDLLNPQIL